MAKKKSTEASAGKAAAPLSGSPMDVTLLEQIVKLMAKNELTGIELQDGDKKVVLQRGGAMIQSSGSQVMAPRADHPSTPSTSASAAPASAPSTPADADAGLVPIKSPMVGTFYTSSGPDAKPFVAVGSVVDEESDVCIIEAMKVFNNIKAETRGTIAKILLANGQTVEFGQPLFLVKP